MKNSTKKIIDNLILEYSSLKNCYNNILKALYDILKCYNNNKKIIVCGNGGSATDAQHIVGELMKSFVLPRKLNLEKQNKIKKSFPDSSEYLINNLQTPLPAISLLGEIGLITAYANDVVSDLIFAQQILGYGNSGDILIAISTSGNSKNILYASEIAKVCEMEIIGLTGNKGGKLKNICDILINVPSDTTSKIQELHLPIYHALCMAVENEFFGLEG